MTEEAVSFSQTPDQVLKDEYLAMRERAAKLRNFIETEAVKSTGTGLDVEITANVGIPADVEVAEALRHQKCGAFQNGVCLRAV